jgi:hypothetical protein
MIDVLLLSNRIADDIAAKLHWSEKGVLWFSTVDTNSNETLTNERRIYMHLADRKTYDMNAQNSSSSHMKSIIQEFQSKVHLMLFIIVVQCSINFKHCRITTCI